MSTVDHDDASRLDFVEGVRRHNYQHHVRELIASYDDRVAAAGTAPATWAEVGWLYDTDPAYLLTCGVQRIMQEIAWDTAARSLVGQEQELVDRLDEAATSTTHGRLELDTDVSLPDWYTEHTDNGRDDIHLVPEGYWGNLIVGDVYERGGSVYRLAWRAGYDARPGALEAFAALAPTDPEVVLDLGCAFGGATRVFARQYPDATTIGIDLSAPALRYAHLLTEQAELDVTYLQRDAEDTGLDADSVDLVTAFLLLHEVPTPVRKRILTEALRVLKPGGSVLFLDIPPYSAMSPVEAWFQSFDARGNGENFWSSFLDSDFPAMLRGIGFEDVSDGPLDFREDSYWGSAALWRTGEFNPVHRWVTTARKPGEDGAS